ncbi:Pentatricopeptide repeat-containing protein [Nymphaea thermarum]|nr:Pentatricopeptide repeat-containing protein [Nymphaea thermarum]
MFPRPRQLTIRILSRKSSIPCTNFSTNHRTFISNSCETHHHNLEILDKPGDAWSLWDTIDPLIARSTREIDDNPQIIIPLARRLVDLGSVGTVKYIHAHLVVSGMGASIALHNHLIVVYSKLGRFDDGCNVFEKMPMRNVVSWTVMVSACVKNGFHRDALRVYCSMRRHGMGFDSFALSSVLRACVAIGSISLCHQIHGELVKTGNESCAFVGNVVVDMYVKCGSLDDAEKFFHEMAVRSVVSWTAIIGGYARSSTCMGFKLCVEMIREGTLPDQSAFASVLASLSTDNFNQVMQVHATAVKLGFGSDIVVGCAILDLYLKFYLLKDAYKLFEEMPERNVVSWTAMIVGNIHNGHPVRALELFARMRLSGIKGDGFTASGVLRACVNMTSLEMAKQVHGDVLKRRLEMDVSVNNALIDAYGKCGDIMNAYKVFTEVEKPDLASWNSIMSAFSMHGHGKESVRLFGEMQKQGVKPDTITFVAILSGCSHGGLVEDARNCFEIMTKEYGIEPRDEHYSCMVDLLGRAGLLDQALELIEDMPQKPGDSVWGALLGACKELGNTKIAERAALELTQLMPEEPLTYISLANTYASAGRWESAARVRKLMMGMGMKKDPGCSWIEMDNKVHVFIVGGRSHPHGAEINDLLGVMSIHMRGVGDQCTTEQFAG